VSGAVAAGISEGASGLLFGVGAMLGLGSRIVAGHIADRHSNALVPMMIAMLCTGAGALGLFATEHRLAVTLAVPLLWSTVCGWPGLFFLAVARSNPAAPAAASGISGGGILAGAVAGPLLFGFLARDSYSVAWLASAASTMVAAGAVALGWSFVQRDLALGADARTCVSAD
jgi:cyanate permease